MQVAVAMSGGIDSTVAAWTLKEQGHEVVGLTMRLHTGDDTCRDASDAAGILGIPHEIIDLREPFSREVIEPFCREYLEGRTPNPCAFCNPAIKFGILAEAARKQGADRFATGHYARIRIDEGGIPRLQKAVDETKDQSYFLALLGPEQLAFTLFPLGDITKNQVREIVGRIAPALRERKESQETCFLHDGSPGDYIRARRQDNVAKGEIIDASGKVVGTHKGLPYYTIGQRRGLGVAMGAPMYVVSLDAPNNRVVIGPESSLYRASMQVRSTVWTSGVPIEADRRLMVKIRYATPAVMATVRPEGEMLFVAFDKPVRAITPGQIAAFYEGDEVVGAGIIVRSLHARDRCSVTSL